MFVEGLISELEGICALSPEQGRRLFAHYELLKKWNQVVNLTRIEELGEAIERHYCESLFLAAHLPAGQLSIADIGSGGGFPGIPVAVLRPDCQLTLIESHRRKAVFLREATRDLRNVRVLAERAEDVSGSYEWGIARAVRWKDISWILGRLVTSVALLSGEATGSPFNDVGLNSDDSRETLSCGTTAASGSGVPADAAQSGIEGPEASATSYSGRNTKLSGGDPLCFVRSGAASGLPFCSRPETGPERPSSSAFGAIRRAEPSNAKFVVSSRPTGSSLEVGPVGFKLPWGKQRYLWMVRGNRDPG